MKAPLRGPPRVGLVVAVREAPVEALKPLTAIVDASPVVTPSELELIEFVAARSLSSLGSTAAGLLPPASRDRPPLPSPNAAGERSDDKPELHVGAGRERHVLDAADAGALLVVVPDVDAAFRWAQRLAKIDRVSRLDSGVADLERARAWNDLREGRARLAVGTRSAWIAPLPPGATLAVIDEQEAAHKPPGHPRIHARDVALERARRDGVRLVLTSGAPSVEMWWRATSGYASLAPGDRAPWPEVVVADTRGILRREPLTPELARALRDTLAAGGRAFIAVSRLASALACDECGLVMRCETCGVALAYSRAATTLSCRVCGAETPSLDTCPGCRGRRLSPFGWGAERVEHAIRRRFPKARIVRYEPESRGARAKAQKTAAAEADVVIGTRGALRLFRRGALSLAGFVTPDQLLRLPDFRAGERMLAFAWAAAERTAPGGRLVIQSQNPDHHAFAAVATQELERFYAPELKFRAELGYPPFRRLAIVTAPTGDVADQVADALGRSSRLTVYPKTLARNRRTARIVVKGGDDLHEALAASIDAVARGTASGRGIMDVEVDPVEWPS